MKRIISVFCAVIIIILSVSVGAYALTAEESKSAIDAAYDAYFSGLPGDVNKDSAFSALDARTALLASAGYTEGADLSKADLDGDNVVTAIDARTLLRVSAGLDNEEILSRNNQLKLFNAFMNSIKAEKLGFRKFSTQENKDVTYDNAATINKFNDQMNNLAQIAGESSMDIRDELLKGKGVTTYAYSSVIKEAQADNYPVIGKDFSSSLTLGDIKSIEYMTNQTKTYAPKTSYGTSVTPTELTGLDVLTVYFNSEKIAGSATNTNSVHSKCFDVPTNESVMKEYNSLNEMFTGELESMIGSMSVSTNHISYYDSYISIYFDHDTKKICATEYGMYCDISIALKFDLYNLLLGIDVRNQTVNIVNKDLYKQEYYFIRNYQSLDR